MDHLLLLLLWTLLNSAFCFTEFHKRSTVGEDVELPWIHSTDKDVKTLEWIHFNESKILLVYRGGQVLNGSEHSKFKGRVQLKYIPPKNDSSVTLKNVRAEDSGTYECRMRCKDSFIYRHMIHLTVDLKSETAPHSADSPDTVTDAALTKHRGLFVTLVFSLCSSILF
ncbi:uncharacterized protein LOC129409737 [Boleophthalmus pectinirostris]|uniref:uncharacterized protein LOC129409737 n=1 Tax=Boleophthalmus pectinirostris TaxID=150288 RepID=UPI00243110AA|nr:uncharacterized protein LOC129409737 [Boleophthalmus pectinirostris]